MRNDESYLSSFRTPYKIFEDNLHDSAYSAKRIQVF